MLHRRTSAVFKHNVYRDIYTHVNVLTYNSEHSSYRAHNKSMDPSLYVMPSILFRFRFGIWVFPAIEHLPYVNYSNQSMEVNIRIMDLLQYRKRLLSYLDRLTLIIQSILSYRVKVPVTDPLTEGFPHITMSHEQMNNYRRCWYIFYNMIKFENWEIIYFSLYTKIN